MYFENEFFRRGQVHTGSWYSHGYVSATMLSLSSSQWRQLYGLGNVSSVIPHPQHVSGLDFLLEYCWMEHITIGSLNVISVFTTRLFKREFLCFATDCASVLVPWINNLSPVCPRLGNSAYTYGFTGTPISRHMILFFSPYFLSQIALYFTKYSCTLLFPWLNLDTFILHSNLSIIWSFVS